MPKLARAATREYRTMIMDSHRWDKYVPREGDIVICTYPKCGTTWTQRIVDLLIFQDPAPRPVVIISPWLDATFFAPVEDNLAQLEAQEHRRFLKTHLPFDAVPLFDSVKYIHVARDGRDACMSFHNHMLGFRPEMIERMRATAGDDPRIQSRLAGETPTDPRQFYLGWISEAEAEVTEAYGRDLPIFEFENTYWRERKRDNVLLVHYSDMKANLEAEMRRIAAFLDIEVAPQLMKELAHAATFEEMKKNGDAIMPIAKMAWDHGADRFLNKGTNGRWKDVLNAADLARYDALVKKKWSKAIAAWMESGRLNAGDPRSAAD
jgi:aryl sulfotransferase